MLESRIARRALISLLACPVGFVTMTAAGEATVPPRPDFNGIWDRVVLKPRPAHFDPNFLNVDQQQPPLKPAYMALWKERLVASSKGDLSYDTSVTQCLPKGMPRIMMAPYGLEIVQSERQINMFNEASQETLRIIMDGRGPEDGDYEPSYVGFTRGRWEGSALKTTTIGLRADTLFDGSGIPHSQSLTVEQTFRLLDENTLENIVVSKDPKALEKDWVVRMTYRRAPKDRYVDEAVCLEKLGDSATKR